MSSVESENVCREVPNLSEVVLKQILLEAYELNDVTIHQLHGWVDKNYLVTTSSNRAHLLQENSLSAENGENYVLKVLNCKESREVDYIESRDVYLVRLFSYITGLCLDNASINLSNTILYQLGCFLASVDQHIQPCAKEPGFASRKPSLWHLENVPQLEGIWNEIQGDVDQAFCLIINKIFEDFQKKVVPFYKHFQKGLKHGDCNPTNLLIKERTTKTDVLKGDDRNTFGIIDFGETGLSCLIFEIAIAMCHLMPLVNRPGLSIQTILHGYTSVIELNELELTAIETCVAARAAQVFVLTHLV